MTAFQQLSWLPSLDYIQNTSTVIEQFVAHVYGQKGSLTIDNARFSLFSSSQSGNLREFPPSRDALKQHVLRSAFQAGWVLGNTLYQRPVSSKDISGWILDNDKQCLAIRWSTLQVGPLKLSEATATCRCSGVISVCTTCTCGKKVMHCLSFCGCKKKCCKKNFH